MKKYAFPCALLHSGRLLHVKCACGKAGSRPYMCECRGHVINCTNRAFPSQPVTLGPSRGTYSSCTFGLLAVRGLSICLYYEDWSLYLLYLILEDEATHQSHRIRMSERLCLGQNSRNFFFHSVPIQIISLRVPRQKYKCQVYSSIADSLVVRALSTEPPLWQAAKCSLGSHHIKQRSKGS